DFPGLSETLSVGTDITTEDVSVTTTRCCARKPLSQAIKSSTNVVTFIHRLWLDISGASGCERFSHLVCRGGCIRYFGSMRMRFGSNARDPPRPFGRSVTVINASNT